MLYRKGAGILLKNISLMVYAGTKSQYILIDQIAKYFINTFNVEPGDCLVQVLLVIQEVLGKRNISLKDTAGLTESEQSLIFKEAINELVEHYGLVSDQTKIYFECVKQFKEWKSDFKN